MWCCWYIGSDWFSISFQRRGMSCPLYSSHRRRRRRRHQISISNRKFLNILKGTWEGDIELIIPIMLNNVNCRSTASFISSQLQPLNGFLIVSHRIALNVVISGAERNDPLINMQGTLGGRVVQHCAWWVGGCKLSNNIDYRVARGSCNGSAGSLRLVGKTTDAMHTHPSPSTNCIHSCSQVSGSLL